MNIETGLMRFHLPQRGVSDSLVSEGRNAFKVCEYFFSKHITKILTLVNHIRKYFLPNKRRMQMETPTTIFHSPFLLSSSVLVQGTTSGLLSPTQSPSTACMLSIFSLLSSVSRRADLSSRALTRLRVSTTARAISSSAMMAPRRMPTRGVNCRPLDSSSGIQSYRVNVGAQKDAHQRCKLQTARLVLWNAELQGECWRPEGCPPEA